MAIRKEYPIKDFDDITSIVWEYKTQKEILNILDELLELEKIWLSGNNPYLSNPFEDDAFYILYKDGSTYSKLDGDESGIYKKKNIKAIIYINACDTMVYGEYEVNEYGNVTFK